MRNAEISELSLSNRTLQIIGGATGDMKVQRGNQKEAQLIHIMVIPKVSLLERAHCHEVMKWFSHLIQYGHIKLKGFHRRK